MKKYGKLYNIIHTIESIYLCIKYPFLYPRNRWNGKHYTNWKIEKYLYGDQYANGRWNRETKKMEYDVIPGLRDKAYEHVFLELDFPDPSGSHFRTYDIPKNKWIVCWFHIAEFFNNYIVPIFHCIPTYTEWDAMPEGWRKALGNQYLKELKQQLKKDKMLYSWRITQIKEKNATLHLYCNYGSKELYDIINKYDTLSYYICIDCGKPATKLTGGYVCPYCDDCFDKDQYPYAVIKDSKWEFIDYEND